ncbi:PRD domain-containing protein [Ornithinibacillus sp. L9]|uniref:PRD domain-containing protein n=1 Tax=Ornithinibacillus caprae TaxID=2678566 RepID=A0A6N8FDR9_9BACI|nr:PRD domain-containing protein [Ornithinibacillus caprae]
MVLDKRRAYLLSALMQESEPVHAKVLSNQMGVSQRTIYYDMEQLNNWLVDQQLEPVQNIYGKGFCLPDQSKFKLAEQGIQIKNEYEYQFSEQERILLFIVKILTTDTYITMNEFIKLSQMSRGTVVKDLQKVKEHLTEHDLALTYSRSYGYQITGSEESKRKLLSHVLTYTLLNKETEVFRIKIYSMIYPSSVYKDHDVQERKVILEIINQAEKELRFTLTDEMVEMLSIQLMVVMKRVNAHQMVRIDPEEKNVLRQSTYYHAAQLIAEKLLAQFQIEIPDDEICFVTMHLLGSKVHHDDLSNYSERELAGLQKVVERMVSDFQNNACVIFDDRKGLEKNLISHIKPTYYRLKYSVKYSNDFTESIKQNYPDIFHFTKQVMFHLEYYVGKPIPDYEIAYISLHFGGWLTKEKKQVNVKYRAIIVCENGIGTSNMLKTQLEGLIAGLDVISIQSIREFHVEHEKVDVIFSTNYIMEKDIPVIHVPAILSNVEKERILQQVNELFDLDTEKQDQLGEMMTVIDRYASIHDRIGLRSALSEVIKERKQQAKEVRKPLLNELLTEKTIQFRERVSNWEEAIRAAAEPLVLQKAIRPEYVQAMIDNIHELGPYIVIAPNIALPHSRPEAGVERLGMSFLRLKEPVYFSEKEKHRVQLIVVLAAIDNETHLKALSQLTEILSNESNVKKLIDSEKIEEVLEIINQIK